jgi:hypothetical protein
VNNAASSSSSIALLFALALLLFVALARMPLSLFARRLVFPIGVDWISASVVEASETSLRVRFELNRMEKKKKKKKKPGPGGSGTDHHTRVGENNVEQKKKKIY